MKSDNLKSKTDLKKRTYSYALSIISLIDDLNKGDFSVQIIGKQLLRSATSVGANIVEAQAGSSKRDFTKFFHYSLKSANESKFWLGILRDSNKSDREKTENLLQETIELANIIASSILTLKGRNKF